MTELHWEEPPNANRRGVADDMAEVVQHLKEQPGRWALIFQGGGSGRNRRNELLRFAGCETVSSSLGLYARWPK